MIRLGPIFEKNKKFPITRTFQDHVKANPDDAYAAGFFDGEGCVGISSNKNKWGCSLFINLKQKKGFTDILERLKSVYGGTVSHRKDNSGADWFAYGKTAGDFLNKIFTYSVVKKEQIIVALAFLDLRRIYPRRLKSNGMWLERPPEFKKMQAFYIDEIKRLKRI